MAGPVRDGLCGVAYLVAIASSLLVALTVTPAMCSLLLPKAILASGKEPPLLRRILELYEPTLRFTLKHPRTVVTGAAVAIAFGIAGLGSAGRSFLPEFQRAALSIKVIGENLDQLRGYAERVRAAVSDIRGLVDLSMEQAVNVPQLIVRVDRQAASQYGLSPGRAAQAAGTALWGTEASRIYEYGSVTDVVVRYGEEARESLDAVRSTRMPTPSGAVVPVSAFAEVKADSGPNYILRENVERRIVVTANVADRDLRSVYEDIRARITERVDLPPGVRVEYAGQFER